MEINLFRADHGGRPAVLQESQRRRGGDVKVVDEVIELDQKWREAQYRLDGIKADARRIGKLISECKKKHEDYGALVKQLGVRQPEIDALELQVRDLLEKRDARLHVVGNVLHPSVPVGTQTQAKTVIRTHQVELTLPPAPLDYVELLKRLGVHDSDASVLLQQALLSLAADFILRSECTLIAAPLFVPMPLAQLLADDPSKLHATSGGSAHNMCLASGKEALLGLHAGEWLEEGTLPRKYASIGMCVPETRQPYKGYYGQLQAEVVNIVWVVDPEVSFEALDELLVLCEKFYQQLSLRYRIAVVTSNSTARAAAKEYEIECVLPGTQHHRPLARISNLTDFRSRQLGIRYGPKKQGDFEKRFAALVTAQLFSLPPLLCTLLEQHQTLDGVNLPEALRSRVTTSSLRFSANSSKE